MEDQDKPLSKSNTIRGAVVILVGVLIKNVLHLDDELAATVTDAVTTLIMVGGSALVIYGRYQLGKRLNAALKAATPSTAAPAASVTDPSNPAAGH